MAISEWLDILDNSRAIQAVYGDDLPTLERVGLREVLIDMNRPSLTLDLDLARFPRRPPKKWVTQEFNAVRIRLNLSPVFEFKLELSASRATVDVKVKNDGSSIGLMIESVPVNLSARGDFLMLSSMSAYLDLEKGGG